MSGGDHQIYPADMPKETIAQDRTSEVRSSREVVDRTRRHLAIAVGVAVVAALTAAAISIHMVAAGSSEGDERSPGPVILAVTAVVVALYALAHALQQRRIGQVLVDAEWRTSECTVVPLGTGKLGRTVLHLHAPGRSYRPWSHLLARTSLRLHREVDWAGDPDGLVVVRLPGRDWLTLFKARPLFVDERAPSPRAAGPTR